MVRALLAERREPEIKSAALWRFGTDGRKCSRRHRNAAPRQIAPLRPPQHAKPRTRAQIRESPGSSCHRGLYLHREPLSSRFNDLAPEVGLEPTTLRLTAGCSAIELLRNGSEGGE